MPPSVVVAVGRTLVTTTLGSVSTQEKLTAVSIAAYPESDRKTETASPPRSSAAVNVSLVGVMVHRSDEAAESRTTMGHAVPPMVMLTTLASRPSSR